MSNNKESIKRIFCMLVILVFIFTIAGCSTGKKDTVSSTSAVGTIEASGTAEEKQPLYEIKLLTPQPTNIKKSDETEVGRVIKDKFNIVFELIPYSGDYQEKCNLMLAAGDYPELLEIQGVEILKKYINSNVAVCLDDYLSKSPNFAEVYKDVIPYWRLYTDDGKLYDYEYMLPQNVPTQIMYTDMAVRTDVLEKQGWPKLISEDDYINFIRQGLKDFPNTNGQKTVGLITPFGEPWGVQGLPGNIHEKGGTYETTGGTDVCTWNVEQDKLEILVKTKDWVESVKFFNRMYREGMLDKESFTDKLDQCNKKMDTGRAICAYFMTWYIDGANNMLEKVGNPERTYIELPVRTNGQMNNGKKRRIRVDTTRAFNAMIITKNAKDPARLMALIDWASSDEGQLILQNGIENTHYKRENGKRVPMDRYIDSIKNTDVAKETGINAFQFLGYTMTYAKDGQPYNLSADPEIKPKLFMKQRQIEAYQKLGWKTPFDYWLENAIPTPTGLTMPTNSVDPATDLGKVYEKALEGRVKYSVKMIMAKTDDEFNKTYQELLAEYDKLGVQKIEEKVNESYIEGKKRLKELQSK